MSFFKRLFNSDYRAAASAEAAGNVELAAERYALAGDRAAAVRMHLARAARASERTAEIAALHDALHWAGDDAELARPAAAALGRALYARAVAEGIATARDREKVVEAARLMLQGGDAAAAGEALEKIGDLQRAAAAYSDAGLVEKVESTLGADEDQHRRERERKDAFADYETAMRVGQRDDARDALQRCVATAADAGEYRRLLDALEARLITGGRVQLRSRRGRTLVLCAVPVVAIGRDALCDLVLRTGGVSRRHAEIEIGKDGVRFQLRDAGSRNGTSIGRLPIAGRVPLAGKGAFELGDDCRLEFETHGEPALLVVTIPGGVDRALTLVAAADGDRVDLAGVGLGADVVFARGRPWIGKGAARELVCNGEVVGAGRVQLIRNDVVSIDGEEIDVA